MNRYVDLHCHILPDCDDGPRTMDEALDMLRIAQAEGILEIVATPHHAPGIPGMTSENVQEMFKLLVPAATKFGIRLHHGSEIRLEANAYEDLAAGKCQPLGTGRHVLLELADNADPDQCHGWMTAFRKAGYAPIIAHVERLQALEEDITALDDWREDGCLLQVNAGSITASRWERRHKLARRLLKSGRCDIVATDAHSPGRRAPLLREAFDKACHWVGNDTAILLFRTTPAEVLGIDHETQAITPCAITAIPVPDSLP